PGPGAVWCSDQPRFLDSAGQAHRWAERAHGGRGPPGPCSVCCASRRAGYPRPLTISAGRWRTQSVSELSPIELGGVALRPDELRRAVLTPARLWSRLDVVAETGSTNDDLLAAARAGAPEGTVLAAEHQTRGRGRQ